MHQWPVMTIAGPDAVSTLRRGERTKCRTQRTLHPAASPCGAARRRSRSRRCSRRRAQRRPSRSTPATRTWRCAGTTRCATTSACARRARTSALLGNPNFDDGDRNFGNGSLVTNRFDVLSEFDLIWQKKYGLAGERRRLVGRRVQQSRQYQHGDGEHAGQRPAGGRRALAVHEALRQGRLGRMAGRVHVRQLRRRRHAGQRQGRPAHGVLGRQPAAGRRDPRRVVRAELARRLEGLRHARAPRPRSCSGRAAGSRSRRSRPTTCRSPGSGSTTGRRCACRNRVQLPDVQRRALFGGDSLLFQRRTRSQLLIPGAPAFLRALADELRCRARATAAASATGACPRAGARSGSTARWASIAATRPTSCRRPSLTPGRRRAACRRPCTAIGGTAAAAATTASSTRTRPTSPTSRRRASSAPTTSPTATISTSYGAHAVEAAGGDVDRRRAVVSPEHAAGQRTGGGAAGAAGAEHGQAQIATTAVPANGDTPGALGNTMHGLVNAINIFPKTALFDTATLTGELTWMRWLKVTQNEAVFRGRDNYSPDGSAPIDKVSQELRRARASTSRRPGSRCSRASTPRRRSRGARGCPATRRWRFGGNEDGGNYQRRRRRRHLPEVPGRRCKYIGYYGNYSTDPTRLTPRRRHGSPTAPPRRCPTAAGSLTLKATFKTIDPESSEENEHVSPITDGARHRFAHRRFGVGGSIGRRGQATGHDPDARSAPRRPPTRTARFPSTPAGSSRRRTSRPAAGSAPIRTPARSRAW